MKGGGVIMLLAGVTFLLFQSSCIKNPASREIQESFDLEEFTDNQVRYLSDNRYGLQKVIRLDGREEITETYPDSVGWTRELSILKDADISKPGLRPYYRMETSDSAGLHVERYLLQDSGSASTRFQKVVYDASSHLPVRLITRQLIRNPIYYSSRFVEVTFLETGDEQVVIDSLSVKGYQKIILRDTAFYHLEAKILR